MGSIIMLVIFFAIVYFLLIRPQQKKQKKTREMQSSLSRGDKIVTIGGLHAMVDAIDENKIILECDGSKLAYDRQAIRDVLESRKQSWQEQNTLEDKS